MLLPSLFFLLLISQSQSQQDISDGKFHEIRKWRYLNYTWNSPDQYMVATSVGQYIPDNVVMSGIGHYKGYFYIAVPRMRDGVPATLTRIPNESNGSFAPLLEPYPSWEFNALHDCRALQNVQNIEIDALGRLWIIDGGRSATLTRIPTIKCAPKLVIYDIDQNVTIKSFQFPEAIASRETSYLYDIVVDGEFAYITDNSGRDPGIIVYSNKEDKAWKIRHNDSMRAHEEAKQFIVDGRPVSTMINIAGIALGSPKINPVSNKLERRVYYSPLSSYHLFSISSLDLQEENHGVGDAQFQGKIIDYGVKESQTDGMIMDDKDTLYYGLLGVSGIAKWNTSEPFATSQKLIARDPTYVQWPNAFTFDRGMLITLTDRLQKFIYNEMSLDEDNFRLLAARVNASSYVHVPPIKDSDTTQYHERTDDKDVDLIRWRPTTPREDGETNEPKAEPEPTPKAEPIPTERNETESKDDVKVEPNFIPSDGGLSMASSISLSVTCMGILTYFY